MSKRGNSVLHVQSHNFQYRYGLFFQPPSDTPQTAPCQSQISSAAKVDEAVCQIMRQLFANMAGAPEKEKYKEILKRKQAAHNAVYRLAGLLLSFLFPEAYHDPVSATVLRLQ